MTDDLDRLVARAAGATVVGISGPVAVGKSTIAAALAAALGDAVLLSSDDFLLPNEELLARGDLARKGAPDTYRWDPLVTALDDLRAGRPATVPVYSHDVYDIVGERTVGPARRVVLEGLHVLAAPVHAHLDLAVYVDAPLDAVGSWYVERFARLCAAAGPGSFYERFATMDDEAVLALARQVWEGINLPLSLEHVTPTRAEADVVVVLGADHEVVDVVAVRRRRSPRAPGPRGPVRRAR